MNYIFQLPNNLVILNTALTTKMETTVKTQNKKINSCNALAMQESIDSPHQIRIKLFYLFCRRDLPSFLNFWI
jgi:hypothetical protein